MIRRCSPTRTGWGILVAGRQSTSRPGWPPIRPQGPPGRPTEYRSVEVDPPPAEGTADLRSATTWPTVDVSKTDVPREWQS